MDREFINRFEREHTEWVNLSTKLYDFCGINHNCDWSILPDLVNSLDAQYQYIWPKLKKLGFMIRYQYSQLRDSDTAKLICDWAYHAWIYDVSGKRGLHNYTYPFTSKDNPAIACALAVEKLINDLSKVK